MSAQEPIEIAILLFDRMTALDAIGPYEVLGRLRRATVRFVGHEKGTYRTDQRSLGLVADNRLEEVPTPTVVIIPGGPGQGALMEDQRLHTWIRQAHATSRWTASVCTGSLVLAAAGLLRGVPATTHWLAMEELGRWGAVPVSERVVFRPEERIATAAGVSAGIDLGLALATRLVGERQAQEVQLTIEYDPSPPCGGGSPTTADPEIVASLRRRSRFHQQSS
jgi:transcriptional regulator GlxA family with amidase domain